MVSHKAESAPRSGASAASIAHELLLLDFGNMMGPMIYTWDTVSEDLTDQLTQATRLAFGDLTLTHARLAVCREAA